MKIREKLWWYDFLAGARNKTTLFVRIDIDNIFYMLRILQYIQEGHAFGASPPDYCFPAILSQVPKFCLPVIYFFLIFVCECKGGFVEIHHFLIDWLSSNACSDVRFGIDTQKLSLKTGLEIEDVEAASSEKME